MDPELLAGVGIDGVDEAGEIGVEEDAVVEGAGGDGAADFVEVPEAAGLGEIAAFGGVDGIEMADTLAVFGILAVGDVDAVVVDDGRGDELIARLGPDGLGRVGVELPELFAGCGIVAADPAIALRADGLDDVADLADGGGGPLAVQDLLCLLYTSRCV